jgi:hypothetical protein
MVEVGPYTRQRKTPMAKCSPMIPSWPSHNGFVVSERKIVNLNVFSLFIKFVSQNKLYSKLRR